MSEEGHRITLNVYDLSQGLAHQLSTAFLGKAIGGMWHTGVVVYGNEYYFGGGIQQSPAGSTPYGTPIRVEELGVTHIPQDVFESYLEEISPRYTAETYSLLTHNCNNFSNEVAQFLVGTSIPDYILQLPNEVLSSPMGALILPMIQQVEATMKAGEVPQAGQFKSSLMSQTTKPSITMNKPADASARSEEAKKTKAASPKEETTGGVSIDPLRNARSKLQQEIAQEFAAIMATGTLRASEAAALAARRVMQRYGRADAAA
ncbi:hypothetical protein Nepgr_022254 [Nepenthes gracilis]|uniref:PPPDE domain-containing protein n=1 Tax=Nepenthes gracilis TaxID=150966 RepID=A0AAD3XWT3_NEPGR|nr:hypothetical protein Nepgr_022254 [Nepenthes gracilis]